MIHRNTTENIYLLPQTCCGALNCIPQHVSSINKTFLFPKMFNHLFNTFRCIPFTFSLKNTPQNIRDYYISIKVQHTHI
jgi:hypothetical protein